MKIFKMIVGEYMKTISNKYDIDMNIIEGIHHNEFMINHKFHCPNQKTMHLYHIMPKK